MAGPPHISWTESPLAPVDRRSPACDRAYLVRRSQDLYQHAGGRAARLCRLNWWRFDGEAVGPVRFPNVMSVRILLLEDDGAFALDLKHALDPFGCDVTIVSEGNAGLARAVSERFDLILLSAELK